MLMSANSTNINSIYQKMSTSQIPTGLGLLTTVAQLPTKYKIRYLARAALLETPLDLTVKQDVCDFLQTSKTQFDINNQNATLKTDIKSDNMSNSHPMTPPPSPPKKRFRDDGYQSSDSEMNSIQITKIIAECAEEEEAKKLSIPISFSVEKTPTKPIKVTNSAPRTGKSNPNISRNEKKTTKAIRKLKFDEETSSPVSGTIIRPLEEITNSGEEIQSGDIDPEYNIVEVTEEAKQELSQIKNVIGSYTCKLCRIEFEDAFGLARHRCSCIVLLEYRCPECGKRFNCPANLASHRRWHKPKEEVLRKQQETSENEQQYPCDKCGKYFKRQAYLRKHLTTHKHKEEPIKRKATKLNVNKKKVQKINDDRRYSISDEEILQQNSDSISVHSMNSIDRSNSVQSITNSISTNSISNYPLDVINSNSALYNNSKYESEYSETRSDCSSPGRLQIIDEQSNNLTEEENIAAAALAHLRNGPSVIQHTTATTAY